MANVNGSSNSCDGCSIANVSVCILPKVPQINTISIESIFSQLLTPHLNALSAGLKHITDALLPTQSVDQNNNENSGVNCQSQLSVNKLTHSVNSLKGIVSELNVDIHQIVKLLNSVVPNPDQINLGPLDLSPPKVDGLSLNSIVPGSSELNLGSLGAIIPSSLGLGGGVNLNSQLLDLIQQSPTATLPTADTQNSDPVAKVLDFVRGVNNIKSNIENDLVNLL